MKISRLNSEIVIMMNQKNQRQIHKPTYSSQEPAELLLTFPLLVSPKKKFLVLKQNQKLPPKLGKVLKFQD